MSEELFSYWAAFRILLECTSDEILSLSGYFGPTFGLLHVFSHDIFDHILINEGKGRNANQAKVRDASDGPDIYLLVANLVRSVHFRRLKTYALRVELALKLGFSGAHGISESRYFNIRIRAFSLIHYGFRSEISMHNIL